MATGDNGLTLMSSTTLTSAGSFVNFGNLYTGDYEGLYLSGNVITTATTTCTVVVNLPTTGGNCILDVAFTGNNYGVITGRRFSDLRDMPFWSSAASSSQGDATIGFEMWIPNRKIYGPMKNCFLHGGSGTDTTSPTGGYRWRQGAMSGRSQANINDFSFSFVTTSNVSTDMQIGTSFQLYGLRKS